MVEQTTATGEKLLSGYSGQIFVTVTFGFFLITMGQRLLPPLLPAIIETLNISSFGAGIVLSVFAIVRASAQYPGGRFADQFSRKTVLTASFVLAIFGFSILAATFSYLTLLLGVAMIGGASGLFVPANRALLSDLFVAKRGRAFGINMSASDATGILAAGVAIVVVEFASWQTAFLFVILPVGVILLIFSKTSRESIQFAQPHLELRETAERLFANKRYRLVVTAYAFRSFSMGGVNNFLPVFLIVTQGFSFEFASAAYALRFVVGIVIKPFSGYLGDRITRPGIAIVSLIVTGAGISLLIIAPSGRVAIGGIVLYAIGQKSFGAPMQAYLMDGFNDVNMGGDLGATRAVYLGIGSLGPAMIGLLADTINFKTAYMSAILLLVISSVIILRIELTR